MAGQGELLRRLRGLSAERRAELLARLDGAEPGVRTAPLTFRQEQLWLFDKVSPSSTAYGLGFALRLSGPLDLPALRAALDDLTARHPALRTVFPREHGTGAQVVQAARAVRLEPEPCAPQDAAARAREIVTAELADGFDIDAAPPLRLRLLRLSAAEHVLLLVSHHLILDPRSVGVLVADLAVAYPARLAERNPEFPAEAHPFGEYAAWQRNWAEGPEAHAGTEFWQRALAAWENTEIPADHPRQRVLDLTADTVESRIPDELLKRVRDFAEKSGNEVEDVFLGAFFALVSRHVPGTDLTIGIPHRVLGPFPSARLVGDCGNLLPLRVEVAGDPAFAEVVRRVRERRAQALRHGATPFRAILDGLGLEPDPSRLPLVQLGFDAWAEPVHSAVADGLAIRAERVDTGAGSFELALEVTSLDGPEPAVRVRYATALYRASTARRLAGRFLLLLAQGCADPATPLHALEITAAQERTAILTRWNAPVGSRPPEVLHRVFEDVARAHPERVALAGRGGHLTYGALESRANRLARHLIAAGVAPGDRVPVLVRRGPAAVTAILAVLKAGAAYVPVDLGQPADRVRTIVEDCGARHVLVSPEAAEAAEGGPAGLVTVTGEADEYPAYPDSPPEAVVFPQSLAYVIYTSGSTGRPKGVLVEHRNATGFVRNVQEMFGLDPSDRVLHFASLGFDVSVFEIFGALLTGARLHVVDEEERSSLDALDAILADERITVTDLPPAIMELLDPDRYPALRVAFAGGEAFSGELTTRWARGRRFTNGYGPTETTVTVVAKDCAGHWSASPPMGRAMTNHRAYVVDGGLGLLPPGAVGELAVAGLGVARGYLGRPDLTADRFRPDPYGPPGSRMYLSGDLAGWNDDGDLVFHGRADRQVKVRGVRVELGEVEAALRSLPGVAQAVADVAADPHRGTLLVAYVVAQEDGGPEPDGLRSALGRLLPPTMVPSVFVPVPEIPLTASGKVDRRALPAVEFARPDGPDDTGMDDGTPTERTVATEVFGPLLGTRIGRHVNFFALGGTSLQAIRIAPRVKAVFGVDVSIAEFFAAPTVEGLARIVDEALARRDQRRDRLAAALELVEGLGDDEIAALADERPGDA
ncbi:amino acid adenylation domain-containing protein [Streptomyces sp. NPDC017248]|uniref:non-ribosomal peptide synthetase n=1 Tax=unclassified Streptomyces TaxID=2593676 RepID=UPI003798C3BC